MLCHFFKVTFRNFYRNKLYVTINILGLSLGLTISYIILTWVSNELSYDKFHKDYNLIYRVTEADEGDHTVTCSPAVKTGILEKIPGIAYSTRIFNCSQMGGRMEIKANDKVFTNDRVYFVDSGFFKVFSFPLLSGDAYHLMDKPNAAVITQHTAEKYFGSVNPLGKTMTIAGWKPIEVVVTGVLKDLPSQSHMHFDMLVCMKSHYWGDYLGQYGIGSGWMFNTYFKLFPNSSYNNVSDKIAKMGHELAHEGNPDYDINLTLQPLSDIHLKSDFEGELEANGDIRYIYIFSTIALLIISIAGINYINLSTAYSLNRSREVGLKKVLGVHKSQLIVHYLGESLIISLLALMLSLIVIELAKPVFFLAGVNIPDNYLNPRYLALVAAITLLTGLISGIFPAFALSSMQPIRTLKSGAFSTDKKATLRKSLVVFQFVISLVLLTGTGVIDQQIRFLQNTKLGYDKDHVVVLYTGYPGINTAGLKNELLSDSRITGVTQSSMLPTDIESNEYIDTQDGKQIWVWYVSVDPDFFKTMGIHVIEGNKSIENLMPEQYGNKYVLNQTALRGTGWKENDVLNKTIAIRHGNMKQGPVIGVAEDFHFQSLHFPMRPLVFEFQKGANEYMLVRISGKNNSEIIDHIKSTWSKFAADIPFEYSFLDQHYNMLYKEEARTGRLFLVFTGVSVFIAMLGLFGLASFSAIKRTREIGIRKVFGATAFGILRLLSGDFIKLVLIAFIISTPVSWYLMHKWLQEFAYKIGINPLTLAGAGLIVMIITILTVIYHSMQAANANPVDTLRHE